MKNTVTATINSNNYTITTATQVYGQGWAGTLSSQPAIYLSSGYSVYFGSGTISNCEDPVEELRKRCQALEDWYASKLCEMIGKIEEDEYEINDLKDRIEDLETTLKKLVDVLVTANERK